VLQALLIIAGQDPIDAAKVPRVTERIENPDKDWFEQPAFGDEPLTSVTIGDVSVMTPSPHNTPTPR